MFHVAWEGELMKPITRMNREYAGFGSGMITAFLVERIIEWARGIPVDWSLAVMMFGMLLITGQQTLAESFRRTRLALGYIGVAVIVSSAALTAWTHAHRSP